MNDSKNSALGIPGAGLAPQLARAVEASQAGHNPFCMAILRGKACDCGFERSLSEKEAVWSAEPSEVVHASDKRPE